MRGRIAEHGRHCFALPSPRNRAPLSLVAIALLAGCFSQRDADIQIPFTASFAGSPFSCSAPSGAFAASDLRLYIHDVALIDADDQAVPVRLTVDKVWQNSGVALLDFENGRDNCQEGTTGTHTTLTGHAKSGTYTALQFGLGVPFSHNHADAATADAPLNLGRMHWGWQGGYKFLRFEGGDADAPFRFHLGSTGCEGTIGHITSCSRPNRPVVRLDDFVPGRDSVQIELSALVGGTIANVATACMSEKDDDACRTGFAAVGLDLGSGQPDGKQTLFRVARRAS